MFHDPDEQAPVPPQKSASKELPLGCMIAAAIFSITAACVIIYFALELLAKLIVDRNKPITIGTILAVSVAAITFYIYGTLTKKIIDNFTEGSRSGELGGCVIMPVSFVALYVSPFLIWQLVFWLMGLFKFLPQSEVEHFLIHSISFWGFSF